MRKPLFAFGLLFLLVAPIAGQRPPRIITNPCLPPVVALDRLGLTLAWTAKVPMIDGRDGIATVQVIPTAPDKNGLFGFELVVQTLSGLVTLYDAETGDLRWQTPVGLPHVALMPAAYTKDTIFVTRERRLFGLDRATGRHRLWTIDTDVAKYAQTAAPPVLGVPLLYQPTAMPVADKEALFFASTDRLSAYLMPPVLEGQVTLPSRDPMSGFPPNVAPQPSAGLTFLYNKRFLDVNFSTAPVLDGYDTGDTIALVDDRGLFLALNKFTGKLTGEFKAFSNVYAGLSSYGEAAYMGTGGGVVYAFDIGSARLQWRYFADGPISRTPVPTDNDLFVTAFKKGLRRVDRQTGNEVWKNVEADRLLAINRNFVYATDLQGRLLVLDYLRGRTLARYDLADYQFPVTNVLTDRIYFANHDGRIICLHHTSEAAPFRASTRPPWGEPMKAPPAPPPGPAAP